MELIKQLKLMKIVLCPAIPEKGRSEMFLEMTRTGQICFNDYQIKDFVLYNSTVTDIIDLKTVRCIAPVGAIILGIPETNLNDLFHYAVVHNDIIEDLDNAIVRGRNSGGLSDADIAAIGRIKKHASDRIRDKLLRLAVYDPLLADSRKKSITTDTVKRAKDAEIRKAELEVERLKKEREAMD